jgi:hypothetical protein
LEGFSGLFYLLYCKWKNSGNTPLSLQEGLARE